RICGHVVRSCCVNLPERRPPPRRFYSCRPRKFLRKLLRIENKALAAAVSFCSDAHYATGPVCSGGRFGGFFAEPIVRGGRAAASRCRSQFGAVADARRRGGGGHRAGGGGAGTDLFPEFPGGEPARLAAADRA